MSSRLFQIQPPFRYRINLQKWRHQIQTLRLLWIRNLVYTFKLPEGVYLKSALVAEQPPEPVEGELILQAITIGKPRRTTISNYISEI